MTRLPELRPCPRCGLGMARGKGPHGLAYHECLPVSEAVRILQRFAATARESDAEELVETFSASAMQAALSAELMHRLATRDPRHEDVREALALFIPSRRSAPAPAPRKAAPAEAKPEASKALLAMLRGNRPE